MAAKKKKTHHKKKVTRKKTVHRKKKEPKPEGIFYVGLRDSVEVRRNILESARETIQFLKRYERLHAIREEKMHTLLQLDEEVRELRTLVNQLKKSFPNTHRKFSMPARARKSRHHAEDFSYQHQNFLNKHLLEEPAASDDLAPELEEEALSNLEEDDKLPELDESLELEEDETKDVEKKIVRRAKPLAPGQAIVKKKRTNSMSDLERLEDELAEIEGKLGELA